ncbi:hypothetical protein BCR43DRAFT_538228 [Syncephalastrum racemosum]|uniref:ER transporter 6TM N-terminal domain-containing protein n=1 Tax=Syncephalastrum racemosum TaxID=13706 RepID=A0A1X2H123_SYNRA|nr:hypothetical protein BCR43DRAFT_538228 [Syncephalastrum racemosum]
MGAQFDATFMAVTGVVMSVLWALAGLAASVHYNTHHHYELHPLGVIANALFLFFGILFAQLIRQVWPKFFFFGLHFMVIQIFSMTLGVNQTTMPLGLPVTYGVPLLIGCGISLLVNLVLWPESAVDSLGRAILETTDSSKKLLDMITKQFFLDPNEEVIPANVIDDMAEKMRTGMAKVRQSYKESKYEVSYAYIRPQQLKVFRKSLDQMVKHLSALSRSLRSERELFDSVLQKLTKEEDMTTTPGADTEDQSMMTEGEHEENTQDGLLKTPSTGRQRHRSAEDTSLRRHIIKRSLSPRPGYKGTRRALSSEMSEGIPTRQEKSPSASDREHSNRTMVSSPSPSFASLLSASPIKKKKKRKSKRPKPPTKPKKHMSSEYRYILVAYLESLRDPLTHLSTECAAVLACVREGVRRELNIDDDTNRVHTWLSYLSHVLMLQSHHPNPHVRHGPSEICTCAQTLRASVFDFDAAERHRMQVLTETSARHRYGALDIHMREEFFLIFFFIFTLREVAREIETLACSLEELQRANGGATRRKHIYMPRFTGKWLRQWVSFNNHQSTRDKGGYSHGDLARYLDDASTSRRNDAREEYRLVQMQTEKNIKRMSTRNVGAEGEALFPTRQRSSESLETRSTSPNARVAPEPIHRPSTPGGTVQRRRSTVFIEALRYQLWLFIRKLKSYEFKFALKMAVAVSILCVPAFFPSSAAWFIQERCQWASITVIAIMNPTSGGTLIASVWRIIGTIIGALFGWAALETGQGSPYVLAIFAVLLAIPFFYIHLGSTYNRICIVVLASYMIVAVTRYVNPSPYETNATTVCMIWPFVARHAVRKSISGILNRLGEYYIYLVGTFLYSEPDNPPTAVDIKHSLKMETKIQATITNARVLLELTDHEPRLKGPFPKAFYKEMLASSQSILNHLGSIRVSLSKMPLTVKNDICHEAYYLYRRDMIACMMLHFHTVASSLASKMPLPLYMPSTRAARERLISHRRETQRQKFKNLTWYAMASSSEEITEELEHLTKLVRFIVGETKYGERAKKYDAFMLHHTESEAA